MSAPLTPGRVVAGTYRLASQIRRGQFGGTAWRGWLVETQQRVTVVFLPPGHDAAGRAARRFLTVSAVQHPHLAAALDHGVDGELPYIAFEGLEGETLASVIPRRRFTVVEAMRLADQLLEAAAVAHERDLVHGGLDADCVFLIPRSHGVLSPKILGFGLADRLGRPEDDVRAVAALLAEMTAPIVGGAPDPALPPELGPLLDHAMGGDPVLGGAIALRHALDEVARPQRRPRTGRDARLVLATAPSMKRAMHEVLDFQTSEQAAIPLDLTGAPLNPDGTPVTGRRARPVGEPLVPLLPAVRVVALSPDPGDPDSARHLRPDPDSARHLRPDPDSARHLRPDPDSARHLRPDPDSARHLRPDPDSARHLRPDFDSAGHLRPDADSGRSFRPDPHSAGYFRTDPDSGRSQRPTPGAGRDLRPDPDSAGYLRPGGDHGRPQRPAPDSGRSLRPDPDSAGDLRSGPERSEARAGAGAAPDPAAPPSTSAWAFSETAEAPALDAQATAVAALPPSRREARVRTEDLPAPATEIPLPGPGLRAPGAAPAAVDTRRGGLLRPLKPSRSLPRWAASAFLALAAAVMLILATQAKRDSVAVRASSAGEVGHVSWPAREGEARPLPTPPDPGPAGSLEAGPMAPPDPTDARPSSATEGGAARSEPGPGPAGPLTHLTLKSTPPNAIVSQAGSVLGPTPIELDVPAGSYRFDLAAPGYRPVSLVVEAHGSQSLTHAVTLVPLAEAADTGP